MTPMIDRNIPCSDAARKDGICTRFLILDIGDASSQQRMKVREVEKCAGLVVIHRQRITQKSCIELIETRFALLAHCFGNSFSPSLQEIREQAAE